MKKFDQPQPTSEQQQELLPCPFCGSAELERREYQQPSVICGKCGGQLHSGVGLRFAIERWNKRAQPKPSESVQQAIQFKDGKVPNTCVTQCCDYQFNVHDCPVEWNQFNKVIQCHNCGHVYSPRSYPSESVEAQTTEKERWEVRKSLTHEPYCWDIFYDGVSILPRSGHVTEKQARDIVSAVNAFISRAAKH